MTGGLFGKGKGESLLLKLTEARCSTATLRQEDGVLKSSLSYIANSRIVYTIKSDPVSKIQNKKQNLFVVIVLHLPSLEGLIFFNIQILDVETDSGTENN